MKSDRISWNKFYSSSDLENLDSEKHAFRKSPCDLANEQVNLPWNWWWWLLLI